jgi:hypothetical protein
MKLALTLLGVVLIAALPQPRYPLDGATIANSGSTNAIGWQIEIRSDGSGVVGRHNFSVPAPQARRFLRDARAARDSRVEGRGCMKSVSFGTRLTVTYHGWTSPDLSCPAASQLLAQLARDARQIIAVAQPPVSLHRVRLPLEPRRAPTSPPRG